MEFLQYLLHLLTKCDVLNREIYSIMSLNNSWALGLLQKVLTSYAGELLKRLPKTSGGQTSFSGPLTGSEWQIKLSEAEETVACNILHTAAYCANTANTLEKAIQRDIQSVYADQVIILVFV